MTSVATPLVGLIMGSKSDWETMRHAADMLTLLDVSFEARVVSAHRTPDLLFDYAASAEGRGLKVLIAGAGGAAHLPGMAAAKTILPVLGGVVNWHKGLPCRKQQGRAVQTKGGRRRHRQHRQGRPRFKPLGRRPREKTAQAPPGAGVRSARPGRDRSNKAANRTNVIAA